MNDCIGRFFTEIYCYVATTNRSPRLTKEVDSVTDRTDTSRTRLCG